MGEKEEGILEYLVGLARIYFGFDELLLSGVELVMSVLTNGFAEVANEGIPVDLKLPVSSGGDLLIPKNLIILHIRLIYKINRTVTPILISFIGEFLKIKKAIFILPIS